MFKATVKVIKKVDKMADLTAALDALMDTDVLVGIPEEKSSRKGGEITNAELGYILSTGVRASDMRHEMAQGMQSGQTYKQAYDAYIFSHGDPLWHIPPRPFLEPAIEANLDKLIAQQQRILVATLDNRKEEARAHMERLGLMAQNYAKGWFVNSQNLWDPNAPATIAAKGSDRPNIDTGALRNSIHYVIRGKQ